jgi:hypothetical protein
MSQSFLRLRPRQTPWRARRAAQGIAHKSRAVSDTGPGKLAKAARANLDRANGHAGLLESYGHVAKTAQPAQAEGPEPDIVTLLSR